MWTSNMDKAFSEIFKPVDPRQDLIARLRARCERVEYGRHRMVFVCRNVVYKLAIRQEFECDNTSELFMFERYGSCGTFAPCKLVSINGVDNVLVMRRLEPADETDNLPEWVMSVDCQQVGYDKKGRLMAFDYAY